MENVDNLFTAKPEAYEPPAIPIDQAREDVKPEVIGSTIQEEEAKSPDVSEEQEVGHEQEVLTEELDDYGNPKPKAKLYSEEEVNERINRAVRERLDRLQRNNPDAYQQIQQQDPYGIQQQQEPDWEQQLESYIERTLSKREQRMQQEQALMRQQQIEAELESKIATGMTKYQDFASVVGSVPITDAMTLATRSLSDPAAFLYAAAKTQSEELRRIAAMPDPYSQALEIGRLEAKMRAQKPPVSRSPRPISRTEDDGSLQQKVEKAPTIEDRIYQAAQRKANLYK